MIKNNLFYIAIAFTAGVFIYLLSANDVDKVTTLNDTAAGLGGQSVKTIKSKLNAQSAEKNDGAKLDITEKKFIDKKSLPPIEMIENIIDHLPEHELNGYLNKFFPDNSESLANITDKTAFAKNLAREFLDESPEYNNQADGYSSIHFSTSRDFSDPAAANFVLPENPSFTIYAHLELNGAVNNNSEIFVKWINLDTDETLLFKRKNINPNTNRNWVGFVPSSGWKVGSYLVKLYRFESSLNLIAQESYIIYSN